jgi:hypothetical protein
MSPILGQDCLASALFIFLPSSIRFALPSTIPDPLSLLALHSSGRHRGSGSGTFEVLEGFFQLHLLGHNADE